MAKLGKLSARKVATARPGRYGDGGNLWLYVRPDGGKYWSFRYLYNGRTREMGLGPLHTISLAMAREAALKCRRLLYNGHDPIEERRRERSERLGALTFRECAERFLAAHRTGWKNAKHRQQWENTLATYTYPVFGARPVGAVDTAAVMRALEPVWQAKPETASRLRGRIERVLDWATVRGHRTGDNPARWKGHLQALLPAKSKVRAVKHYPALAYQQLPAFMAELRQRTGVAARALEFAVLTAARSGEVRGMTWNEIDFDAGHWTIPSERMKAGKEHRVPLSVRALAILDGMRAHSSDGLVFPGQRARRPLSNMSMGAVLTRMGHDTVTVHGFRSTFRDWTAEATAYAREVCEHALAHRIKDAAEAAYQRGDLFDKRQRLMAEWSGYCASPPAKGAVVPIRRGG